MRRRGGDRATVAAVAAAAIVLLLAASAWARSSSTQAGYQAAHDVFRSVHARWVIPTITCPGPSSRGYDGAVSFAVGLGPSYANSEQVTARAFCTGTVPSYVAYFEVGGVQAAGSAGGFQVGHGDTLSASVSYLGVFPLHAGAYTYRVSRYRFALVDQTTHQHFTITDSSDCLRFRCSHLTAEVSAGVPSPGYPALANYGRVTFSAITITDATGHRGGLGPHHPWRVSRLVEVDPARHLRQASPSRLVARGTSFSDFWHAY